MRAIRMFAVMGALVIAAECGGNSPTRPSGSTLTGVTINGADALLTGASTTYTATTTAAGGTTRTVTPAWTSSNPSVAAIDSAGRVQGLAHGSTTLTASFEGSSASKVVHVVNNYGGTWQGSYVIRACSDTGELTDHDGGWCAAGPGRVGTVDGILLNVVQGGSDLSAVTAILGSYSESLTGTVSADGRLNLGGTLNVRDSYYDDIILATVQLRSWDTTLDGADDMKGGWSEDLTSLVGRIGTAHTDNELAGMHRTAAAVPALAR